jgi:hypothetical protein
LRARRAQRLIFIVVLVFIGHAGSLLLARRGEEWPPGPSAPPSASMCRAAALASFPCFSGSSSEHSAA